MDEPKTNEELFPLIYGELRRVARRYLGRERRGGTFQPTALVHEAWMRLQGKDAVKWQGRTHGLALGAKAMRRFLIDQARRKNAQKRGQRPQPVSLEDVLRSLASPAGAPLEDLMALEVALAELEAVDPRAAEIVSQHYYSGMTLEEVADNLEVSLRTVQADLSHSRAYLKRRLSQP
jgi:RNA polymerase sigma-70 factor, ECF subfamily